jgi:histidyl-tRNA synthetase
VMRAGPEHAPGVLVADLKIARGLDYYTGTVYEIEMCGYERFGKIGAGGRYDNLASVGADRYPGVGISIGITRLLGLLFGADALQVSRQVPTCVLVALPAEEDRPACEKIARVLRGRGIATEVSPNAAKYGRQIRFAERRGIPYVWFPGAGAEAVGTGAVGTEAVGAEAVGEVKDIRSGDQVTADPRTWVPFEADLRPTVSARTEGDAQ